MHTFDSSVYHFIDSRARRSRIIVAGGVYNRQSAFYRRTDSVTFSISQDKIICKSTLFKLIFIIIKVDQQQSLHYMRSHCCGVILDGRFHLLGGQTKLGYIRVKQLYFLIR